MLNTAAAAALEEVAFVAPFDCELEEIAVTFQAGITANGTNFATFTLNVRNLTTGTIKTAGFSVRATSSVGFTAFARTPITITTAPGKILKGETVAVAITHSGAGVAVPRGVWEFKHTGKR
jgi:hypothetical protein